MNDELTAWDLKDNISAFVWTLSKKNNDTQDKEDEFEENYSEKDYYSPDDTLRIFNLINLTK